MTVSCFKHIDGCSRWVLLSDPVASFSVETISSRSLSCGVTATCCPTRRGLLLSSFLNCSFPERPDQEGSTSVEYDDSDQLLGLTSETAPDIRVTWPREVATTKPPSGETSIALPLPSGTQVISCPMVEHRLRYSS